MLSNCSGSCGRIRFLLQGDPLREQVSRRAQQGFQSWTEEDFVRAQRLGILSSEPRVNIRREADRLEHCFASGTVPWDTAWGDRRIMSAHGG